MRHGLLVVRFACAFVLLIRLCCAVDYGVCFQIVRSSSSSGDKFGSSVSLFGLWMVGGAPVADTTGSEENGISITSRLTNSCIGC